MLTPLPPPNMNVTWGHTIQTPTYDILSAVNWMIKYGNVGYHAKKELEELLNENDNHI